MVNQTGVIHQMFSLSFDVGLKQNNTKHIENNFFSIEYSKNYHGEASTELELNVV